MRFFTSLLLLVLVVPAVASAGGSAALVQDCRDGRITGAYSPKQYRDALRDLPTDVDEYSDCRGLLRAAQLRTAAPRSAPPGGDAAGFAGAVPQVTGAGAQPGDPRAAAGAGSGGAASTPGAALSGAPASSPAPGAGAPRKAAGAVAAAAAGGTPLAAERPAAPVVAVTNAGADVPAGLALVLTVLGSLALVGAGLVRRRRRA